MASFFNWLAFSLTLIIALILIILIRVTTPRLRLETLTRLGWLTLLAQVAIIIIVYVCGFLLG